MGPGPLCLAEDAGQEMGFTLLSCALLAWQDTWPSWHLPSLTWALFSNAVTWLWRSHRM